MKWPLKAGAVADTLTQDEHKANLDQQTVSWFQERARGVSTARFDATGAPAGGSVTLPGPGEAIGPDRGFAWTVQRITADGLAAGDVLTVWRGSFRLGQVTMATNLSFGSKGCILRGGERLTITGTGLTAPGDVSVNGEALEVPEADLYKVV
jgi:hypothetical protein